MAVNATIQVWRCVHVANVGTRVRPMIVVTNTGTEEQDFRVKTIAIATGLWGGGETLFTDYSAIEEIHVGNQRTFHPTFTMPHRNIDLTFQTQWHNKTAQPYSWDDVGGTDTWSISVGEGQESMEPSAAVSPAGYVTGPTPRPMTGVNPLLAIGVGAAIVGGAYLLFRRK